MVDGVRGGCEELIGAYGISRRLAVRIGALAAKRLRVTATLLEMAGAGSPLERLLLHPQLLAEADALATDRLRALAQETGGDAEGALTVLELPDARVIALEEEVLAEQASPPPAPTALAPLAAALPAERLLDRREARQLFTPEEIARLKLDAIAGRDADARISALRKLALSPLDPRDKGGIILRVLLDSSGAVRAEAVRALEQLGFHRDAAEALQQLFQAPDTQRGPALRRLADLLARLNAAEREIVLVVLLEVFRESTPQGEKDPLLSLLVEATPAMQGHPGLVAEATRRAVQRLVMDPAGGAPLRLLLVRLAESDPRTVADRLWEEVETVRDPVPRSALLELLTEIESDAERQARLCERVLDDVVSSDLEELPRQRLGHSLILMPGAASDALARRFASVPDRERARLLPFVDALCAAPGLPDASREALAGALLHALTAADPRLRIAILNARLFSRSDLPRPLRRALAAELFALLRTTENAELAERALVMIEALGAEAVEGLFAHVTARPNASEADAAVRALARMVAALPEGDPAARCAGPVWEFVLKRTAQRANHIGGYPHAVGILAASAPTEAASERLAEAFRVLLECLPRARCTADVVDALSRVAATPCADPDRRVQTVDLLCRLVDRPLGEEETSLREVETSQGTVFEITGRIEFDTDTLPAAVTGLARIALSDAATDALRARIAEMCLRLWDEVAAWKRIWGPRGAAAMAAALSGIGAHPRSDAALRVRALRGLARGIERIAVVKALDPLFRVPSDDAEYNAVCVETAAALLDHWIDPEIAPEQLEAVLCTVASAVARPRVRWRAKPAQDLRRRATDLLFESLRARRPWARAALERIRDSAGTPRALQEAVAERLRASEQASE